MLVPPRLPQARAQCAPASYACVGSFQPPSAQSNVVKLPSMSLPVTPHHTAATHAPESPRAHSSPLAATAWLRAAVVLLHRLALAANCSEVAGQPVRYAAGSHARWQIAHMAPFSTCEHRAVRPMSQGRWITVRPKWDYGMRIGTRHWLPQGSRLASPERASRPHSPHAEPVGVAKIRPSQS